MNKDIDQLLFYDNESLGRANTMLEKIDDEPVKPAVRQLYIAIGNLCEAIKEINNKKL